MLENSVVKNIERINKTLLKTLIGKYNGKKIALLKTQTEKYNNKK